MVNKDYFLLGTFTIFPRVGALFAQNILSIQCGATPCECPIQSSLLQLLDWVTTSVTKKMLGNVGGLPCEDHPTDELMNQAATLQQLF